jgi:hypothetical protein
MRNAAMKRGDEERTSPIGAPSSLYNWLRSKPQACSMTGQVLRIAAKVGRGGLAILRQAL